MPCHSPSFPDNGESIPSLQPGQDGKSGQDQEDSRRFRDVHSLPELQNRRSHADHRDGHGSHSRHTGGELVHDVRPEQKSQSADKDGIVGDRRDEIGRPLYGRGRNEGGGDYKGNRAVDELPGRGGHEIEVRLPLHPLDDDGAERPEDARQDGQDFAHERCLQGPGFQEQHQPGEGQHDGKPVGAADRFAEDRPGEEQDPEGHGIDQDGCLSRPATDQRPDDQSRSGGRLEKPQQDRERDLLRPERHAPAGHEGKKNQAAQEHPGGIEVEGSHELQGLLHDDPVVTPDQRQQGQRSDGTPVG